MKINLGNFEGEYVADQAGATYVLKAGAAMINDNGRAIDADDGATGRSFVINGTVTGAGIGMTIGSIDALANEQHLVIGRTGIIDADGTAVGFFGDGSALVNRGFIRSLNDNAAGIATEGQDVSITNSGTIVGQTGIRLLDDDATVSNSGKISAVTMGVHFSTDAMQSGRLVNSGTIVSDGWSVHGSAGEQTIVNSGILVGSLLLADGKDVFRNQGGSVVGTVFGGMGDDTYYVDKTSLKIVEASNQGSDTVKSSISWTLGAFFENGMLTGKKNIDLIGNDDASSLSGNRGRNDIDGKAGVDFLNGKAGDDRLAGGAGADIFIFHRGGDRDTITDFEDGVDRINLSQYKGIDGLDDVSIKNSGDDVLIALGKGDSIRVAGIEPGQLTDTDFVF